MERYSPLQAFKVLRIIHLALIAVPALFGLVVLFINLSGPSGTAEGLEFLLYLPGASLIVAVPAAGLLFKQNLNNSLGAKTDLKARMAAYQTAHMIRMAIFETSGLLAAVVCFVTGTMYNMVVLLAVIVVFLMKTPSVFSIETAIGLSPEEKSQLIS